jgi:hypothetical protein
MGSVRRPRSCYNSDSAKNPGRGILAGRNPDWRKVHVEERCCNSGQSHTGRAFDCVGADEVSHLPGTLHSFLNYFNHEPSSSPGVEYMRHSYLISLGFLITRIVGYSLMAVWLRKCGPDVEKLLLPAESEEVPV